MTNPEPAITLEVIFLELFLSLVLCEVRVRAVSRVCLVAAVLCAGIALPARAINIQLEYVSGTLFSPAVDAQAKTTIAAAAADLSAAITSTFNSITSDTFSGTSGASTANLGFGFSYADPLMSGNTLIEHSATVPGNRVRILVGSRDFTGSTRGVGGTALLTVDSSTGSGVPSTWQTAVTIATNKAHTAYSRGGGPIVQNFEGTWPLTDTTVATIDFDYGVSFGSLALDNEVDVWHYDYTTPVAANKTDLYSVALHEMMHVLGIGTSLTWNSLVSGTNWLGSEVIELYGSGANLIASPSTHLATTLMSQSIVDGAAQPVVMTPNIGPKQRRYLTTLDLAFLRDLGYSTIEPTFTNLIGDFNNDGDVNSADLTRWKNSYALNANADADGDGDSDGEDFLLWQRHYGETNFAALSVAVPEPASLWLLAGVISLYANSRTIRRRKGVRNRFVCNSIRVIPKLTCGSLRVSARRPEDLADATSTSSTRYSPGKKRGRKDTSTCYLVLSAAILSWLTDNLIARPRQ